MLLFPPTSGLNARPDGQPVRFDFTAGYVSKSHVKDNKITANSCLSRPQSADQIHSWISRHLPEGLKPAITRPINYFRLVTGTTIALGVASFISVAHPYITPIIQNRNIWAAISLIIILLFTSGQMFNHIRKVPYVAGDGKGGISYFAGGFSNQFGMETQIVAAMCNPSCVSTLNILRLLINGQMAPCHSLPLPLLSRFLECQTQANSKSQCSCGEQ